MIFVYFITVFNFEFWLILFLKCLDLEFVKKLLVQASNISLKFMVFVELVLNITFVLGWRLVVDFSFLSFEFEKFLFYLLP